MAIAASIWIYWLACGVATTLLVINQQQISNLLSPDLELPQPQPGYRLTLMLGWAATLLAAIAYISFTHKQVAGTYHIQDLVIFSLLNGVLEQLMFICWFLLGCWFAHQFNIKRSWQIFGLGFLSYAIYSGAIHALFWIKVLPDHQPAVVMPFILVIMSLAWMWLFWRYRAIVAMIAMHIAIDFLTVGHLHFPWFEPY
jgi:chlorophyllide a hydrolase